MFRPIRRNKQELSQEINIEILKRNKTGVLALYGIENYPYAVPINYFYYNSKIYFHCAKEGHKIDAIKNNSKVSFCVIDKDELHSKEYTTYYRSVIVFGKMKIIDDLKTIQEIIEKFSIHFAPKDSKDNRDKIIKQAFNRLSILELTPHHISGKESIELVNAQIE